MSWFSGAPELTQIPRHIRIQRIPSPWEPGFEAFERRLLAKAARNGIAKGHRSSIRSLSLKGQSRRKANRHA